MNGNQRYSRYFTYIQPILKNPVVHTYGYTIFTIIMTIIFILFAIKPTVETIVVLQKQLTDQKTILSGLNAKTEALGKARQNYQAIPDNQKIKLDVAMPNRLELANVIQSLEGSALSAQASISALQFQQISVANKVANNQQLAQIKFTFNVAGSYDKLKAVLLNLKQSPRIISVDSLVFNKVEGENTILMAVTGKAYYIK